MKKRLVFVIPALLLIGFLAIKPPAIGKEQGDVVVTPEATYTPAAKPHLRDFDDEGNEPAHFDEREDREHHDDYEDEDHEGREHHDDHDDEYESDEDGED
ncbi:MAG: hypothetical protein RL590_408 [Actinomycetota bacterium]|jgi:hypothetical protein